MDETILGTEAGQENKFLLDRELCRLPKCVWEEIEAYLRCGLHHYGFLRIRCPDDSCGFEHAVPFNCKKRGFCSSCVAKRAAEIEEHLTGAEKSPKTKVGSDRWARFLKRVFASEVSRCGGDLELITAVLNPAEIACYPQHVGMPAAPPARAGVKMRVVCEAWY